MARYRRFCNKIYQATRYVLSRIDADFVPYKTLVRTGAETLPERWIMHKFNVAADNIHKALDEREFSQASQIVYHYWYDHLCDVFIENSKKLLQESTPEEKAGVMNTLYSALEGGLTLIHPFMPFLSEELFQRLPRRPDDTTPSIVVAAYPAFRTDHCDPEASTQYELLLACSRAIRSLTSEYGLKQGGEAFIYCRDAAKYDLIESETAQIGALVGKSDTSITVTANQEAAPTGCAVCTVSSTVTVLVDVAERVDPALIAKTHEKLIQAKDSAARQRKLIEGFDSAEMVSSAVRELEMARLAATEAEASNRASSIEQFKKLCLAIGLEVILGSCEAQRMAYKATCGLDDTKGQL